MSEDTNVVPTSYSFQDYDAKHAPTASDGNRIAKCLYRSDNKEARTNSYVEVPSFTEAEVTDQLVVLMPHLITYLETVQDGIIKGYHTSSYTEVFESAIKLNAVIDKLESAGEGRLNKEQVFSWFDETMKDSLTVAFADKMGLSDEPSEAEEERLTAIVDAYRTKLGALAGGKSRFMPEECVRLQQAIDVAEADETPLGARFMQRLEKMQEPEQADELLISL